MRGISNEKAAHLQNLFHFRICKNFLCSIGIRFHSIPGAPRHVCWAACPPARASTSTVSRRPSRCLRQETAESWHTVTLWAAWWCHSLLLSPPSCQVNHPEPQHSCSLLDFIYFSLFLENPGLTSGWTLTPAHQITFPSLLTQVLWGTAKVSLVSGQSVGFIL